MSDRPEFAGYLKSIAATYAQWWTDGALTQTIAARQATFTFKQSIQTEEPCEEAPNGKKKIPLPLFQGVHKYAEKEHVLLVGSPGIGKSTTLLRLLVDFAKQELEKPIPRIPVRIVLKRYRSDRVTSEDPSGMLAMIREALKPKLSLKISEIEELFQNNRLILLWDGLNEMPANTVSTELKAFREMCDRAKVPLICTTRESGNTLGIKRRLEIQPLTPQGEIQRFLDECMPSKKQEVLELLNRDNRELSCTPFVLWMLYDSFRQTGDVAKTMGEVFHKFFESFSERKEDAPVPEERRRQWDRWLEHLAFSMLNSPDPLDPGLVILEEQAEKILTEKFGTEPPSRINELMKHHLLQKVSHHEIEFHHQLIQEYYAAEALLLKLNPRHSEALTDEQLKQRYLNYLKWTEPIALMLGLADEGLALRVVELAIGVDLMLGARLAGEVRAEFQERSVKKLVERCIELGVCEACEIQLLGETCSEAVVSKLSRIAVENSNFQIRIFAIFALEKTHSKKAIPALIIAFNNPNEYIRMSASEVIEKIPSEESFLAMLDALKHSSFAVRQVAAQTLGKIGDKRAIPQLIETLKDPNLSVRRDAFYALQTIDDTQVFSVTEEGTSTVKFDEEHNQMILERFNQKNDNELAKIADFPKRLNDFLIEINLGNTSNAIRRAFADEDPMMNIYALEAIKEIGCPSLLEDLWQLQMCSRKSEIIAAIATIQSRCKFYNYEIFQAAKTTQTTEAAAQNTEDLIHNKLDAIAQGVQKMSDVPKYNFPNAKKVQIFEQIDTYIENNIGSNSTLSSEDKEAIAELKQVIQDLQAKYPSARPEQQAIIIEAEFQEIKQKQPWRWKNLLSYKRLLNGGKTAAIKVGEHFAEENPWGKGAIAFLEGVSEDIE